MHVDTAGPADDPEAEAQSEPATPVTIAPADIVAAPDEDEEEDSDADDSAAQARAIDITIPAAQPTAPAKTAAATAEGDRWAGTMSREWNENEKQTLPDLPEVARKPKAKARPKITVEQAVEKIPADALKYIRENFKTDVQHIRSYDPARTAKS